MDGTEEVGDGISPAVAATPAREGTDKLAGAVINAAGAALACKPGSTHANPIVVPSPAAVMALREYLRDNTWVAHEDEWSGQEGNIETLGSEDNPIRVRSWEMAVAIRERFAADAGPYISLPEGTDLSGRDLRGLNLTRVVFKEVNMSGADLSGANLENAVMVRVNIDATTKLTGANMAGIHITASTLSCDLSGINLSGASIWNSSLSKVDMIGADLSWALIRKTTITWGRFRWANLVGASLIDVEVDTTTTMVDANIWSAMTIDVKVWQNLTLEDLGAVRRDPMVEANNKMLQQILARV